jgi:hypothetical protein
MLAAQTRRYLRQSVANKVAFDDLEDHLERVERGAGMPASGTSGTGAGTFAHPDVLYVDTTNHVVYINEGTLASPYWSPLDFEQPGLISCYEDFRNAVGKAASDTAASAVLVRSGLRIHGQGVAELDSGLTVAFAEGGNVASLLTTDEAAHTLAISAGHAGTAVWQPDVNGRMVIDALLAHSSAITERAMFLGFLGTCADALDPAVTGSATTLTLVQDDLAGLFFDSGLTDPDRLFAPHNKSDAAASIATTAAGVDTGVDIPAAGTYTRLRVEIGANGTMTCFKDKVQVTSIAAALDVDEECAPVLYVESNAASVKTMLVKQFAAYTSRA